MSLFKVDSTNVLGKFVQEAGSYNVKVLATSEFKTSKKGDPMAMFNYEVLDGKYAGASINYDNMVWKDDTTENVEKSIRRFNTILVSAGLDDGIEINSINDVVRGMINKKLNITVDWQFNDFNGSYRLGVKGYSKIDSEGSKPNGKTRPELNNNNVKKGYNASRLNQQPKTPFASANNEINISDDDLPF